ncbi:hypothetical protein [Fusobacterium sp. PH5-44]|uniref:hypothetical protein n=1 Tax=unclassified Fusobacterium TaxID=2648384 RepID=UPI003D24822A
MKEKIRILLSVKSAGNKKQFIREEEMLVNPVSTTNHLIAQLVEDNVEKYNKKEIDKNLFQYLTTKEIEDKDNYGKISFEDRKNEKQQNIDKAKEVALLAYYDTLVRLFVNDEEKTYDEKLELFDGDKVILIKMTMLAGRMW